MDLCRSCTAADAISASAGPPETAAILPQFTSEVSAKSARQVTARSWIFGPEMPIPCICQRKLPRVQKHTELVELYLAGSCIKGLHLNIQKTALYLLYTCCNPKWQDSVGQSSMQRSYSST